MASVKFGYKQILNPTPASLNRAVRATTVVIGVFMAWMATASVIGTHTKDTITQILGLMLGLINGLAPLFGIPLVGNNVPAADVTAIENK